MGLRVPGATPMPERFSTTVAFVWSAEVAKVTLPVKFPIPAGANVIVAELDVPDLIVSGRARLLIENPAPLIAADVMITSVPPLFESVTVVVWWLPTLAFPKSSGEGLGESFPSVTAVAEADREAYGCAFGPSKEIVMVGSPVAVGWNLTLKLAVCPAANVIGAAMPVIWKPELNP